MSAQGVGEAIRARRQIVVKLIPVVGSVVLFLSWIFQQTSLEEANSTIQRISAAEGVYQTYQSNNALFNAVIQATAPDQARTHAIRRLQMRNYEYGLFGLEAVLDDEEKLGIPPTSDSPDVEEALGLIQERLTELQIQVREKKQNIVAEKDRRNTYFRWLYAFGTMTVVVGTVTGVLVPTDRSQKRTERRLRLIIPNRWALRAQHRTPTAATTLRSNRSAQVGATADGEAAPDRPSWPAGRDLKVGEIGQHPRG